MSFGVIALFAALGLAVVLRILEERGFAPLGLAGHKIRFPGPSALPFFGNMLEFRKGHTRALMRWANKFGPIMRIVIGDREAVVLNTYDAVQRTLMQQSVAFQGRPETRAYHGFFVKAVDEEMPPTMGTSAWSDKISQYRKHLGLQTSGQRRHRYDYYIARRLHKFVGLLNSDASNGPRDLGYSIYTTTVGISADMCFGSHIDESDARSIAQVKIDISRGPRTLGKPLHASVPVLDFTQRALRPAHRLLKTIGLKPLSQWLDGIVEGEDNFKVLRAAEIHHAARLKADLAGRMKAGDNAPSQLGDVLRAFGDMYTPAEEYKIAASLVGAGTTTGTLTLWTAGLLASRPDIQAKAYAAIEAEYGDAVPDPMDTGRVEYIAAIGAEAGRYFATMRIGFTRETTQDTEVDGVRVPQGTFVMHNTYAINRDPARYDHAEEFIPERWIDGHYGRVDAKGARVGVPHMNHGVGRRGCIGVPYADKILYGAIILLVHSFKLERAELNAEGLKAVFPAYRANVGPASFEMNPITDQVTEAAGQAIPRVAGVKLVPRNSAQLSQWLADYPTSDQMPSLEEDAAALS